MALLPNGETGLLGYAVEDTRQKKQNHQESKSKIVHLPQRRPQLTRFSCTFCSQHFGNSFLCLE